MTNSYIQNTGPCFVGGVEEIRNHFIFEKQILFEECGGILYLERTKFEAIHQDPETWKVEAALPTSPICSFYI